MVTAVASLAVVYMLLDFMLFEGVLITVNSYWAPDIAAIISVLAVSLIVGYVFAGRIKEESKM